MKNGGPAFPIFDSYRSKRVADGMTLRDYLAAQAMQGILANPGQLDNITDSSAGWVARDAYKVADAMIKAREGE